MEDVSPKIMKDVRCKSKNNYYNNYYNYYNNYYFETNIKVAANLWKSIKQLTTFNCTNKRYPNITLTNGKIVTQPKNF